MTKLLWLLALFALAVGIALAARFNEGYLLLVLPPYRAEVSLNLAIFLVVTIFVVVHGLLRTIGLTLALPNRVQAFRERRRRAKAAEAFHDAVRLLFEGRFGRALKRAGEAHAAGHSPGLAALLAARAAQLLREPDREKAWLERVRRDDPRLESARLMVEAEMFLDTGDFGAALITLQGLQRLTGRHIAALRLELRAQEGCANWPEVLRLARLLERRAGLPPALAHEFKLNAHQENIRRQQGDLGQIVTYLRHLPRREKGPRLVRRCAEALLEEGARSQAQRLIEEQLDAQWESELVQFYGQIGGDDPTAAIARAEKWLPEHPGDAQLLLALGRLCRSQRLWGKAENYLEASLALADQHPVRLELACLFEQTDRSDEAVRHYRAAAEQLA